MLPRRVNSFRLRGYHRLWPSFPAHSTKNRLFLLRLVFLGNKHNRLATPLKHMAPAPSEATRRTESLRGFNGLGSSPFARHYLGNHYYFLFLRLLRCFSSPGPLARNKASSLPLPGSGFPHSEIRGSKVACHLTAAYRRLLRPSSSSYVKASTIYSYWDFPTLLFSKCVLVFYYSPKTFIFG